MAMMISKFHKIIQNKTVWAVFAVIICVAFVGLYTGNRGSNSGSADKAKADDVAGKLFGEKVTRSEYGNAYRNTYLMLMLNSGRQIKIDETVDSALSESAWQRLAVLKKAEQKGITVTDKQLSRHIRQQRMFMNQQTGLFDNNVYDMFARQIGTLLGTNMEVARNLYENMLRENIMIDKISSSAVQGALVTEDELERAFHLYSDELTVKYASIPRSLVPETVITEEEARAYYEKYSDQFAYPDMVKVKYVTFPVADYADSVTVTEEQVAALYQDNLKYFVVEGTEQDAEPQYKPLEEVRDQIVERATKGLALQKAASAAGLFVSKLANQTADFDEVAKAADKEVAMTSPFSITDTVRGIDATAQNFTRAAFNLEQDKNHYYSDPVAGSENVYVLALVSKMPSFLPDFSVVAEDATEAARVTAAEDAYYSKADEVKSQLEKALGAGTDFDSAAAALGLTPETTEAISLINAPTDELASTLLRATYMFPQGALVDLVPTKDVFMAAFIAERKPADRSMADPMVIQQLKANIQQDKASRMADAWREALMKEANLEILLENNS